MNNGTPVFGVSDAAVAINQTLEYAFPNIKVIGEVANYKISGGKWVFFDIKDDNMSLKCFMTAWTLRTVIEDGMKIEVLARPRLGKYGLSLNIDAVKPVGEGNIKKAYELLHKKLEAEGLFAEERKRSMPYMPEHIGVISSTGAAGYKDFLKILENRFVGIDITVFDVAVQGDTAADQIIDALKYFNESESPPEVIAIIRGGGSRDDLSAFDDELLVRTIASSRVPTITGVGHEIDTTLADFAADKRASTPSNVAEILLPDKREVLASLNNGLDNSIIKVQNRLQKQIDFVANACKDISGQVDQIYQQSKEKYLILSGTLKQVNPSMALKRGYAVVRGENNKILREIPRQGTEVEIEIFSGKFLAKVMNKH